jgi:hypothetical protein
MLFRRAPKRAPFNLRATFNLRTHVRTIEFGAAGKSGVQSSKKAAPTPLYFAAPLRGRFLKVRPLFFPTDLNARSGFRPN